MVVASPTISTVVSIAVPCHDWTTRLRFVQPAGRKRLWRISLVVASVTGASRIWTLANKAGKVRTWTATNSDTQS